MVARLATNTLVCEAAQRSRTVLVLVQELGLPVQRSAVAARCKKRDSNVAALIMAAVLDGQKQEKKAKVCSGVRGLGGGANGRQSASFV